MSILSDGEVRIRPHPFYWGNALFVAAMQVWLGVSLSSPGGLFPRWFFLVLAAFVLASAAWAQGRGTVLREDHLESRRVRSRRVPWPDIAGISAFDSFGEKKVMLHLVSGEQIELRAPSAPFGLGKERLLRDYHRIGQAWESARRQA